MPSYPVLQPDGKLAIWSTIVDHFTAFDCDVVEAVEVLAERYRDSPDSLTQWCGNVLNGKREYPFMQDWADCLGNALGRFGPDDETVKEAMERTPDELTRRYVQKIQHIWKIERRLDESNEKLAAVPVEELRRLFSGELSYVAHRECMDVVESWIKAQEAQP